MCQTGAAVFDEGAEARYVVIDGRRMQPERGRIVPLSGGKEGGAEGAPRDRSFAVAGFHSARRGACEANPDSRRVFRFGLDEAGRAQLDANSKPMDLVDDHGRLWNLMSANTVLGSSSANASGKDGHGVNIEGLAARNGQLYFGFREPAINKTT